MKFIPVIISLLFLMSCKTTTEEKVVEDNKSHLFFVGTYTNTDSKGIYAYSLAEDGKLTHIGLAATSDNPSFLTKSSDNRFLIAVNEISNENKEGTIESFEIKGDSLLFINRSTTGGAHPCFVSINEDGFVLSANYTGGNIGLLRMNIKGELSELLDVEQHEGKGTDARQEGPHAHSAWFEPSSGDVISVDLGTNELWFSKIDTALQKLLPTEKNKLGMAPGAGPRHLVFHPNNKWVYVVNELIGTVALLEKTEDDSYKEGVSISTLPEGYSEPNTCADIHISSDGKFVYASNRGHNSIAIFEVNANDGSLSLVGHESTRGDGPRNFSLSPDEKHMLVANQLTQNIVSYKRDEATGLLVFVDEIAAPTPVCILF
ncbi:MAG: lactonase family protein [Cyclobacteriaceae bacterium]|nr:lactonase family protein [Cyclobacteriaceae bacterium]